MTEETKDHNAGLAVVGNDTGSSTTETASNFRDRLIATMAIDDLDQAVSDLCGEYQRNPEAEDCWFKQDRAKYVQKRDALIERVRMMTLAGKFSSTEVSSPTAASPALKTSLRSGEPETRREEK